MTSEMAPQEREAWDKMRLDAERAKHLNAGLHGGPLGLITDTRWGWLLIPATIGLAAFLGLSAGAESDRQGERWQGAQKLWLAECSKPIDECAVAWDKSWTLRRIYFERANPS